MRRLVTILMSSACFFTCKTKSASQVKEAVVQNKSQSLFHYWVVDTNGTPSGYVACRSVCDAGTSDAVLDSDVGKKCSSDIKGFALNSSSYKIGRASCRERVCNGV